MKDRPQIYTEFISHTTVDANPQYKDVDLGLGAGGENLVSTIHKVDFIVSESLGIAAISFIWALRKNRRTVSNVFALDEDTLIACGGRFSYFFVASGAALVNGADKFNAPPNGRIDCPRPGRFWVQGSGANINWAALVYYSLREVSGAELEKLLVKFYG